MEFQVHNFELNVPAYLCRIVFLLIARGHVNTRSLKESSVKWKNKPNIEPRCFYPVLSNFCRRSLECLQNQIQGKAKIRVLERKVENAELERIFYSVSQFAFHPRINIYNVQYSFKFSKSLQCHISLASLDKTHHRH